jgi:hypothetical protein
MKSKIKYAVKVFAAGFIVIVLLSIPLFWLRLICQEILGENLPDEAKNIYMRPSGLVPSEIVVDHNIVQSLVSAYMNTRELPLYGIINCFKAEEPAFYYYSNNGNWSYFDKTLGLIVCAYAPRMNVDGKVTLAKAVTLYAGPDGISETAAQNLGRFVIPIVDTGNIHSASLVLTGYDRGLRCFFAINFVKRVVTKGPQLSKNDFHKPIQIGRISGISKSELLIWSPPMTEVKDTNEKGDSDRKHISDKLRPTINYTYSAGQYELVLDESGRIDLLDKETLVFAGKAGFLPAPQTLYDSKDSVTPKDLLDYDVLPVTLKTDNEYRGILAKSVLREGTSMALAVFDEKGRMIKCDYTKTQGSSGKTMESSVAFFFGSPAAPVFTITRYLLENLQPPVLSMASFITADSFSAVAGHNALFILPNSFVAMSARQVDRTITAKLFLAMIYIILPSLVLSIWLTCKVARDAAMVGLSDRARFYWKIGTILFGLTAYITYRLTRPGITLVTCENCGKLRRPDMEKCHRCGSKWHVPELTAPAWRVVD